MNIVLINPPSPCLNDDTIYTPIGLMSIAGAIRLHHNVSILDLTGGVEWGPLVEDMNADLVGITCVSPNFNVVADICNSIPDGIPIVIGGPHPTFLPIHTLRNTKCTSVVVGEGEVAINNIIGDIRCHIPLKPIYYGGIVEVDKIYPPAYDLIDLNKYNPTWATHGTTIQSSRGCPYNCAHCSKSTGRTYREIPIPRIMSQVEYLHSIGITDLLFSDDNFGVNRTRAMELLSELGRYDLRFRIEMDVRHADRNILELAKYVGCIEVAYGVESGNDDILRLMNKGTTVADNIRAIELTMECGINAKALLMVNFPGETEDTAGDTLKFVEDTTPDKVAVSAFVPMPGCDVYNNPDKYGITWLSNDYSDYYIFRRDIAANPCFTTEYLTIAKQQELHDTLYNGILGLGYDI